MTPSQRAKAWYPTASVGGGNKDTASGVFLWKPVSDSNGKAAVHTPAGVRIKSISVNGKEYGFGSYGNGYRPLFRLDKPGSAFGNNVSVHMNLHSGGTYAVIVPSGGKRFEKSGFADSGTAPDPVKPPVVAPPAVSEVVLPADYASKVGLVAIVQGRKFIPCTRDPSNPARWTHAGRKAYLYGVRWSVKPPGSVATFNALLLGLWSVTNGVRFFTLAEINDVIWGKTPAAPPVVSPVVVTPPPTPPPPVTPPLSALHHRGPGTLTMRADFAAVVTRVDAMASLHETAPGVLDMAKLIILPASRSGNTWTIAKPLGSYPVGNRPNTWRIRLTGKPPAGVTYHTSIMQSFLREGDSGTYPPTIRK